MIGRVLLAAMLASLVAPARALAEDIVAYEAEGNASSAGADPRVAALDDAFAHAVTSALADLVTGDQRTAHKGELAREIVGHARLWVSKFTVTKDDTSDGRRQLVVSVRVDRDKIRARLAELSIPTREDTDTSQPSRTITILLRVTRPDGVTADFGQAATQDVAGLGALTGLFRSAGMAVRRAPASGPAPGPQGDFPVEDEDAEGFADAARADLAAVAGVTIGQPVPVRGMASSAALVTAHLRLIDRREHKRVGQGTAMAAAMARTSAGDAEVRADDPGLVGYAVDRALLAAAADVMPPAPKKLAQAGAFHGDDTPIAEPGVVLVRVSPKTPYSLVVAEQRYLAGARGVRAATLRRLSPGGWVIGVTTNSSREKVAQIAKRPPASDTSTSVKIVGDLVEVSLSGAP